MAKLYVEQGANGNVSIISEWTDNENGAKQAYHNTLKNLYAAADVSQAYVQIIDEQLDVYQGFKEFVNKIQPEPEQSEE